MHCVLFVCSLEVALIYDSCSHILLDVQPPCHINSRIKPKWHFTLYIQFSMMHISIDKQAQLTISNQKEHKLFGRYFNSYQVNFRSWERISPWVVQGSETSIKYTSLKQNLEVKWNFYLLYCSLVDTLTQSRLTLGLKKENFLKQYKALNASIKDTSLQHNLETFTSYLTI